MGSGSEENNRQTSCEDKLKHRNKAVAVDVAALKSNPLLPGGFLVSGLVYDVGTGRIELVVPPALLRPE
jgi:hypothetical protein